MKKLLLSMLMIVLLTGLNGCSKGYSLGSYENNTSSKMTMNHYLFKGSKERTLKVNEGEEVVVSVDIKTENGTLDAYIYNEDTEEYIYEGKDIPTSSFTVTLKDAGNYTIKVDGDKHKGSYSFTW